MWFIEKSNFIENDTAYQNEEDMCFRFDIHVHFDILYKRWIILTNCKLVIAVAIRSLQLNNFDEIGE